MSEPVQLDRRRALHVLNSLQKVGPVSLRRLLDTFDGDPLAVLAAPVSELQRVDRIGAVTAAMIANWREHFDVGREEELLRKHGGAFVALGDTDYPPLLPEIFDPPIGLNFLGAYRVDRPCIAIVGTRRPTLYGRAVAGRLARELARLGFCIVSGMARGIDSEAHAGALEAGGKTVAVLGCGADIVYPPENLDLYREISANGAVVSEFPFGRRADKQTFPMRNRVVSGLSRATVVVESDAAGGSMITARFAGEHGRLVFAVPGRIDQATSRGCHQLIRDGATLLTSVDDILEEMNYLGQLDLPLAPGASGDAGEAGAGASEDGPGALPEGLGEPERRVAECFLDGATCHPDQVVAATGLPPGEVNAALLMLELKRVLAKRADGAFERRWK